MIENLRALSLAGDVWGAEALARRLLASNPADVDAARHLVSAIRWQRDPARYPEAIELGRTLLAAEPAPPLQATKPPPWAQALQEVRENLAGMLFELGAEAAAVRCRLHAIYGPTRAPVWRGESLRGMTLKIIGAWKGHGLNAQHPDIAEQLLPFGQIGLVDAARILWVTDDSRWAGPLTRSDRRVKVIPRAEATPSHYDKFIAAIDLPRLTLVSGKLQRPHRYIEPAPGAVAGYSARLPPGRPRVGLAWRGGKPGRQDYRNPPLSAFAALAAIDATFVCLQYGDVAADLAQLNALGVDVLQVPGWDPLASLDDAFALTDACDAVVTNDQSAAHIAGALGKPTFLLSAFYSHFTTYGPPGRSAFYPSLRVLTQPRLGDWGPVFEQVLHCLRGAPWGSEAVGAPASPVTPCTGWQIPSSPKV